MINRKWIGSTVRVFEPLVRSLELEWTLDFDTNMVRFKPNRNRFRDTVVPEFRIPVQEFLNNPKQTIFNAHYLLPGGKDDAVRPDNTDDPGIVADKIRAEFGPDVHIEPDQDEDGTINGRFL